MILSVVWLSCVYVCYSVEALKTKLSKKLNAPTCMCKFQVFIHKRNSSLFFDFDWTHPTTSLEFIDFNRKKYNVASIYLGPKQAALIKSVIILIMEAKNVCEVIFIQVYIFMKIALMATIMVE